MIEDKHINSKVVSIYLVEKDIHLNFKEKNIL